MAHECPECGYTCHCNGDIECCDLGDVSAQLACTHCEEEIEDDEDFEFSETAEQAFSQIGKIQ